MTKRRLRPYQKQVLRSTTPAVESLKTYVFNEIVHQQELVTNRYSHAVMFIARFCEPATKENIRFVVDMIAKMNTTDFDDLNLIRQYLRGE